jgi:hypothetical protein
MTGTSVLTAADCTLDGVSFDVSRWPGLSSSELARIVGVQIHEGAAGTAEDYKWELRLVPLIELQDSALDGEPDGGWAAAYLRQLEADREAVASGSPEYAGRDRWIRDIWLPNTACYPLFAVIEDDGLLLWDGHHRLAGAVHYGQAEVWTLVGTRR